MVIGIRKETQYPSEKRAALTPDHVREIIKKGIYVVVETANDQRIFTDEEYLNAGAHISNDLDKSKVIFGVKEVPIKDLIPNKTFVFFSHTIKGQEYNMPMLKSILEKNITLIDYELVKDKDGYRIIFFGKFAGYAGIIDSLWLLGKRLEVEGLNTSFNNIEQAIKYNLLDDAKDRLKLVGEEIQMNGLPDRIVPFITGFTGYGNVAKGAQELYDILPHFEIAPDDLEDFVKKGEYSNKAVYKVEFKEEDMYFHSQGRKFDLQHFLRAPNEYKSKMYKYLPYLSLLVNGIYWEKRFPKHVTKQIMKDFYEINDRQKLKVIGDITCDIEGSIELTVKATSSDNPSFVYEPLTGEVKEGIIGNGPVILAVDKLPAELPKQASKTFGDALLPFVESLTKANYNQEYKDLKLPDEFKNAVIAHKGELTPQFKYLDKFLT
jgi:alpha-aminoadipic semialdehyde synthase